MSVRIINYDSEEEQQQKEHFLGIDRDNLFEKRSLIIIGLLTGGLLLLILILFFVIRKLRRRRYYGTGQFQRYRY